MRKQMVGRGHVLVNIVIMPEIAHDGMSESKKQPWQWETHPNYQQENNSDAITAIKPYIQSTHCQTWQSAAGPGRR